MKNKWTYKIRPEVNLTFNVIAEDKDEAESLGFERFHVWLEKATKKQLADEITDGLNATKADVFKR
jgi:hypothetical protein